MFPIILDTSKLKIALVGNGPAALRRLKSLDEAGGTQVTVFADRPGTELETRAGDRLRKRLPAAEDLRGVSAAFIADFDEETSARLAEITRNAGALVNVEDNRKHCDFHVPSIVRRGDLLLSVSSGGKSPALARRIRQELEVMFDMDWAHRLNEMSERRREWRESGMKLQEVAEESKRHMAARGWFIHFMEGI